MNKKEVSSGNEEKMSSFDEIEAPNVTAISPTKIADQFWCEMQLHLKLQLGLEPTEVMIVGAEIHRSLEEELGPIIELVTTTKEDNIIAYILQIYSKLQVLQNIGLTREIPIIGMLKNIPILGIIDQLSIEEYNNEKLLVITDYKTRQSKRAPSYEQKRRNRIQMQVYWYILRDLISGKFTIEMFKNYFEIPKKLEPSPSLLEQLPEELKELLKSSTAINLLEQCFGVFHCLPKLSEELKAIYMLQEDQTIVFTDRTLFHEESFEVDMDWALEYWLKKRMPKECSQRWICNYCQFTDKCGYFLRRYLNEKKKS